MKDYNLINQRATTCKHGGHCEWIACDKCSHYEPDVLNQQPCEDCRNCKEWNRCPCGKEGHENGTSIGYSIGECKNYEPCDDCISRQAVLDMLEDINAETEGVGFYYEHYVEYIKNLPSVTSKEKTGWIPVSERLPEEFESVLVCYESQGGMAQAVSERFGTHTGYRWSALAGIEPIAWMPLPKPYEPQESEDKE